jgi:serine protease Do
MKRLAALAGIVISLTASVDAESFSREALQRIFDRVAPAIGVVRYTSEVTDAGSGELSRRENSALALVVSPRGLVMAHGHMILENSVPLSARVILHPDGNEVEYEATILGKPQDINVTFLQLESTTPIELPHVEFNDVPLSIGQPLMLFGVLPESLDLAPAMMDIRIGAILKEPRTTYALSEPIRFGYVTGPCIDTQGRIAGIVGFDLSRSEGGDVYIRSGHPLLYQTSLFQRYLQQPPGSREETPLEEEAWLGVFTQPLTDELADYWKLPRQGGLVVSTIVPNSPAAQAGLQIGDVITAFNEVPVQARLDSEVVGFTKLVRETGANKTVPLRVLRAGQVLELETTLGTRPRSAQDAAEWEEQTLGLTVRELTTDMRIALNLPQQIQGVLVRRVRPGSPAQIARVQPGVLIMSLGGHPVTSVESFQEAAAAVATERPKEIALFGRAGSETGFFRIEPRWEEE